ncbi:MAG: Gfo/Idh/MocA family oxidoreductase [Sphaerochaeta sp.]|nr:Gfo/Idh/MocA family oxidoreductase [Sphaerochaeta sp.]
MNTVRIGIIGYGKMGSQHTKAFLEKKIPNARLTAIADSNPEQIHKARLVCKEDVSYFTSAEDLIKSGTCDAIIPTVPHYFHPVYAVQAFQAGLHVLCEKPAGVYTKQVEEMNRAAKESGKVFGIMLNQRTNPVFQKAREMVQGGQLGRIIHTNWIITSWFRAQSYYDLSSWRATWKGEGGGVLLNQNPHNLDLWQWICGMPSRVKAEVYYGKHRSIEVEDDVYALFEYPNGAVGIYTTTIADAPGTNRLEITGSLGKLVLENNTLTFWKLKESSDDFNERFKGEIGQPECTKCEVVLEGTYTSHPGIITNFCDAILSGSPLLSPGEEGIKSLEISNAIHLSSWMGGTWVDLPIDGDLFKQKLEQKCGGQLPV